MQWSDIAWTPPTRTLRQFAGLWLLFVGGLACWHGLVHDRVILAAVLAILALAVGLLGLIKPRAIRPVFLGCLIVTFPIGWVVSRLLLGVLFYGIFTPVALVFRVIGRDALQRRYRPDQSSYWEAKPMPADTRSYLRPF